MKSLNSVMALLIGAAILTAGTGCKHTPPKPPTLIPGRGPGGIDDGQRPIAPVTLPRETRTGPGGTGPGTGTNPGPVLNPETNPSNTGLKDPNAVGSTDVRPNLNPGEQTSRPNAGDYDEHPELLQAETIYFDLDRSSVKASEMPKLERIAAFLKSEANSKLRVEGNCDERGTEEYNRSLGERRALGAREVLVNLGISPDRITTTTYGEDKPADPGHDEAAWAKNRRDDFVVLRPKTGTGLQ